MIPPFRGIYCDGSIIKSRKFFEEKGEANEEDEFDAHDATSKGLAFTSNEIAKVTWQKDKRRPPRQSTKYFSLLFALFTYRYLSQ